MSGIKSKLRDFASSFEKLVNDTFIRYKGVTIEKLSDGKFKALSQTVDTLDLAKSVVDNSLNNFNNQIKFKNGNEKEGNGQADC
jgi:hypothetical protein